MKRVWKSRPQTDARRAYCRKRYALNKLKMRAARLVWLAKKGPDYMRNTLRDRYWRKHPGSKERWLERQRRKLIPKKDNFARWIDDPQFIGPGPACIRKAMLVERRKRWIATRVKIQWTDNHFGPPPCTFKRARQNAYKRRFMKLPEQLERARRNNARYRASGKAAAAQKLWVIRNPERVKAAGKRHYRKAKESMSESHVRKSLTKHHRISTNDLPQSVVEAQRELLRLKRLIKEKSK